MDLVAEFTSEPFHGEGEPPDHARAALEAVERAGLEASFGPFGTTVRGDDERVVQALADVLRDAFASGATRVTLQVGREDVADSDA